MSKELNVLLESELLNDDTKKAVTEAMEAVKLEAIEEARKELDVKYAKKSNKDKAILNESLVSILNESIETEMKELREDINAAKKTEIRYAKQLQEFKEAYATKLSNMLEEQIKVIVEAEMGELREDIEKAKENRLGQRIFEAYKSEFEEFGVTEDYQSISKKLEEAQDALLEAKAESVVAKKHMKITELLEGLTGGAKAIMKTILENVEDPEGLEKRFEETIDAVLDDEDDKVAESESEEDESSVEETEDEDKEVEESDYEEEEADKKVEESKKVKAKAILENVTGELASQDIEILRRRAGVSRY